MKANAYDHHIITKAIIFAAKSHQGAIRKGTEAEPIPYIFKLRVLNRYFT